MSTSNPCKNRPRPHIAPISPTRTASEAENHKKDGPCQALVLPNLPSVAGRVKYAMAPYEFNQFSQRTGISGNYLGQLCSGKAKTLSAYNANRIARASSKALPSAGCWVCPRRRKSSRPPRRRSRNCRIYRISGSGWNGLSKTAGRPETLSAMKWAQTPIIFHIHSETEVKSALTRPTH